MISEEKNNKLQIILDAIKHNYIVNTIDYYCYCVKIKYYSLRNYIYQKTFLGAYDRKRLNKKADKKLKLMLKQNKLTGDE